MKKAYLAIKFYKDCRNRKLIEQIVESLYKIGFESLAMIRDFEKWGEIKFSPKKLMNLTFEQIDKSDLILVEFSEKGIGLGIEAGYAYAKNIPIIVIAKKGSDISTTMQGVAKKTIFYNDPKDLTQKFKSLKIFNSKIRFVN